MIDHFLPLFWASTLFSALKQTDVGHLLCLTDSYTQWGDVEQTPYGNVSADHGMYFNFFVRDVDAIQKWDSLEARNAAQYAAKHIAADLENYVLDACQTDQLPALEQCRVYLAIPWITAYQPDRSFCDGIKGLVLCGLIKIGDENYDFKPRPYQPD